MRKRIALALLLVPALVLAACKPPERRARVAATATPGPVASDRPTSTPRPTLAATAILPAATLEPVPTSEQAWDLPAYPGATADAAEEADAAGTAGLLGELPPGTIRDPVTHVYRTGDSMPAVVRFYEERLEEGGWQRAMSLWMPGISTALWRRGNLLTMAVVEETDGTSLITLTRGESVSLPPGLDICTAREAYARAAARIAGWRQDAYLVQLTGGEGGLSSISRGGCSQKWQFTFYSPGEKKWRDVGVGYFAAEGGLAMGSSQDVPPGGPPAQPTPDAPPLPLEDGWLDSPQVYAAARAAAGAGLFEKYPDAALQYTMRMDPATGRTQCAVVYTAWSAPEGSFMNWVYQAILDGRSGELIRVQFRDGEWLR